jgi:hypothetical protein
MIRLVLALLITSVVLLWSLQQLMVEPPHDSGQSVTAAYEGWFANADETSSLLSGYYNRNVKQELDIPIGRDNSIEPGGPDQGQPTHLLTRRQWVMSPEFAGSAAVESFKLYAVRGWRQVRALRDPFADRHRRPA